MSIVKTDTVIVKVKLTFDEIYNGTTKKIRFSKKVKCTFCKPKETKTCFNCNKTGLVLKNHTEEINFPKGIAEGMIIQLKNKGHLLKRTASKSFFKKEEQLNYGNLEIHIEEKKHDLFTRYKSDLVYNYKIEKFIIANEDRLIEINHLNKEIIKMTIPKGVSEKRTFRIKELGFFDIKNNKQGNLLIVVDVV
jgi:molecular chaperone DnaJ